MTGEEMVADTPTPSRNSVAPGFIGRDQEFAHVAHALRESGSVVLVEGEAGIGKSRLVHEFLRSSEVDRDHVLFGVCPPFRDPFPLGPIVTGLRVSGASIRPARNHPPRRPKTRRNVITTTAVGVKSRRRSAWLRTMKITPGCTPRESEKYPATSSTAPASMRKPA